MKKIVKLGLVALLSSTLGLIACNKGEVASKKIMWSDGKSIEIHENEKRDLPPANISLSRSYISAFEGEDKSFINGQLSLNIRVWDYGKNPGIKSIEIYEDGNLLKRIANAKVKEPTKEFDGIPIAYTNEEEQFSGFDDYESNTFHRSVWFDVTDRLGKHDYFVKIIDNAKHEIKTRIITVNHDKFKISKPKSKEYKNEK